MNLKTNSPVWLVWYNMIDHIDQHIVSSSIDNREVYIMFQLGRNKYISFSTSMANDFNNILVMNYEDFENYYCSIDNSFVCTNIEELPPSNNDNDIIYLLPKLQESIYPIINKLIESNEKVEES